jgi:hypothetical protein
MMRKKDNFAKSSLKKTTKLWDCYKNCSKPNEGSAIKKINKKSMKKYGNS